MDRISISGRSHHGDEIAWHKETSSSPREATLVLPLTHLFGAHLPVELAERDYGQDRSTFNMSGFFEELKRRKVYRVAIAYIVAGWALAQGLAQVFHFLKFRAR